MADSTGEVFDIVILGGGSGGYACAFRAAELGLTVALVERDKLGGTCLHRGCIPTKALLHAAEIADQSRESAKFGVKTAFEGIDVPGVQRYKNSVVDRLWRGLQSTITSRKIDARPAPSAVRHCLCQTASAPSAATMSSWKCEIRSSDWGRSLPSVSAPHEIPA